MSLRNSGHRHLRECPASRTRERSLWSNLPLRAAVLHNLDNNYGISDKNGEYRSSPLFIRLDYAREVNRGFA